jgi:hypothetical protein
MNIRKAGRSLSCALVLGLALAPLAWADDPPPPPANDPAPSCGTMMDQAMLMLLKMPAGSSEKVTAQKELVTAKVDNDKGDGAGCKAHVNNAIGAMTARNPG